MPCKNGRPERPDPNAPLEVTCEVSSLVGPAPLFIVSAQKLLAVLEETRHIGDSVHPNRLELEAQRALLRHAIRHRAKFHLRDDHWGRTGFALLKMFEAGDAEIEVGGKRFRFENLTKVDWREGTHPLASHGGFEYHAFSGEMIFKITTWVS
jgi:hypothetical protein